LLQAKRYLWTADRRPCPACLFAGDGDTGAKRCCAANKKWMPQKKRRHGGSGCAGNPPGRNRRAFLIFTGFPVDSVCLSGANTV